MYTYIVSLLIVSLCAVSSGLDDDDSKNPDISAGETPISLYLHDHTLSELTGSSKFLGIWEVFINKNRFCPIGAFCRVLLTTY